MSIFAIADLHLSFDGKVEKPMDIYGGAWINHAEKLKKNWEALVAADDTVLIPGDVSWALKYEDARADLDWIDALPGKKIVTKGNHDLWWASTNKLNGLYEDMYFLQNHCCLAEDRVICGSRGWTCPGSDDFTSQDEKIYNRELLRMEFSLKEAKSLMNGDISSAEVLSRGFSGRGTTGGMKNGHEVGDSMESGHEVGDSMESGREAGEMDIGSARFREIIVMMHYPPTNDKLQASGFTDLFERYGVKLVVYGHLHGNDGYSRGFKGNFNGVEYKLVSFDYLNAKPLKLV